MTNFAFPSPCGVWVVSLVALALKPSACFRPLAGCGLFRRCFTYRTRTRVSVPLRGVGCFDIEIILSALWEFPSPCGVWVVSVEFETDSLKAAFPSPCGVWVVSRAGCRPNRIEEGFRPLAGCGLFLPCAGAE